MMASRITRLTLPHQLRIPHRRPLHHLSFYPIRMFQRFSSQSADENAPGAQDPTNENAPGARDPANGTPNPKMPSSKFTMLEHRLQSNLEKSIEPLKDSIKEIQTWIRWIVGTFVVGIMLKLIFYDHRIEEKGMNRQAEMEQRLTNRQVEMEERLTKTQDQMEERLTKTIQNSITQLKLELKLEHQEKSASRGGWSWWR